MEMAFSIVFSEQSLCSFSAELLLESEGCPESVQPCKMSPRGSGGWTFSGQPSCRRFSSLLHACRPVGVSAISYHHRVKGTITGHSQRFLFRSPRQVSRRESVSVCSASDTLGTLGRAAHTTEQVSHTPGGWKSRPRCRQGAFLKAPLLALQTPSPLVCSRGHPLVLPAPRSPLLKRTPDLLDWGPLQ